MREGSSVALLPRLNWRPERGLSLAESILTLALMGMVMSIFALIVKTMTTHGGSLERKDEVVTGTLAGLERISRDVRMGVVWHSPARNQSAAVSTLELEIPDYENDPARLPPYAPGTMATPAWNPQAAGSTLRIRYRVVNSELLREVRVGGVYQGLPLAFRVAGLSAQRSGRAELSLTLSVDQSPRPLHTLTRLVHLPLPLAWRQP